MLLRQGESAQGVLESSVTSPTLMPAPRLISQFLIDGYPDGRISCELHNWTGKAYRIPRNRLRESANRDDLHKAGVYFLFGRPATSAELGLAYVGEAEDVYKRLPQHQDKDFWTEVLIFVSKDANINKAHVKFLEYRAHTAATKADRFTLVNANTPPCPVVSEAEEAVLGEFFENLKLLTGSMGYRIFESLTKPEVADATEYRITGPRGASATAVVTGEGVVVRNRSAAAKDIDPSTAAWVVKLRDDLVLCGVLVPEDSALRFTRDHLFASPSAAAAVVLGRVANGRIELRDNSGKTLKQHEDA